MHFNACLINVHIEHNLLAKLGMLQDLFLAVLLTLLVPVTNGKQGR